MKRKNDRLVALAGAVLCVCACLVGCERKEPVPSERPAVPAPVETQNVSRAHDAVYQAQVRNHIADQRSTWVGRGKIVMRMEQLVERAQKALPAGATDEQVTAELEGHPQKYPAWRELGAALRSADEEIERNRAAAQTTVRRRVLREVAERAKSASPAGK